MCDCARRGFFIIGISNQINAMSILLCKIFSRFDILRPLVNTMLPMYTYETLFSGDYLVFF